MSTASHKGYKGIEKRVKAAASEGGCTYVFEKK